MHQRNRKNDTAGIHPKTRVPERAVEESEEVLEEIVDGSDPHEEEVYEEVLEDKYPPRPRRPFLKDFSVFNLILQTSVVAVVVALIAGMVYYVPKIMQPSGAPRVAVEEETTPEESAPQTAATTTTPVPPQVKKDLLVITETETGWLNVRESPSLDGTRVTRVLPGEEYEYLAVEDEWYQIKIDNATEGWVFGDYIEIVEE